MCLEKVTASLVESNDSLPPPLQHSLLPRVWDQMQPQCSMFILNVESALALDFTFSFAFLQVDNVKKQCNSNIMKLMDEVQRLELVSHLKTNCHLLFYCYCHAIIILL